MASDPELLHAWRAGDGTAGSALFHRHFDAIHRFFRNKLDTDIEDLVQRTFIACVEGRDRFREESSFRTYLFAVAHNLLKEHLRRKRRAPEPLDLDLVSAVDLGASPLSLMAAHAEEKILLQALRQIPLAAQTVLELYYWEALTGGEIGELLGVPEDTARSRLRRARLLLEAEIQRLQASPHATHSTLSNLDHWAAGLRRHMSAPPIPSTPSDPPTHTRPGPGLDPQ
ncbi:MAG: sigma-70 family RNA polymerase sigma factor [Myxococcales bacterium]|nr:sigma-70 family RNA polymerase sigma factor [Myxococcales bacterium]